MRRHPNPRLVKMHRSYTVEETARLLGKHKNTVRAWIKQGLQPIDGRKPTLIHGLQLVRFLQNRRMSGKQPCPPSHMYCLKCRSPYVRLLLPRKATLSRGAAASTTGRVAFANLTIVGADLEIAFPHAASRLRDRATPSVTCDSSPKAQAHENP